MSMVSPSYSLAGRAARLIIVGTCLAATPAKSQAVGDGARAPVAALDATVLKEAIQELADNLRPWVLIEGTTEVRDEGGVFVVSLGRVRVKAGEVTISIGEMEARVAPLDAARLRLTIRVPASIPLEGADGTSIGSARLPFQETSLEWDRLIGTVTNVRASYRDLDIRTTKGSAGIRKISLGGGLTELGSGKWAYNGDLRLEDAWVRDEDGGTLRVGEISGRDSYDFYLPEYLAAARAIGLDALPGFHVFAGLGINPHQQMEWLDPAQKERFVKRFVEVAARSPEVLEAGSAMSSSSDFELRDFEAKFEPTVHVLLRRARASWQTKPPEAGLNSASAEMEAFGFNLLAPRFGAIFVPENLRLRGDLSRWPVRWLIRNMPTFYESASAANDAREKAALWPRILSSATVAMAEAGTELRFMDTYLENPTLRLELGLNARADGRAAWGAVGEATGEISGLDEAMRVLRAPRTSPEMTALVPVLELISQIGNPGPVTSRGPTYRYRLTLDEKGQFQLNGKDAALVLQGLAIRTQKELSSTTPEPAARKNVEKRLEELRRLLDKGLISPEDAARKRKEILESL